MYILEYIECFICQRPTTFSNTKINSKREDLLTLLDSIKALKGKALKGFKKLRLAVDDYVNARELALIEVPPNKAKIKLDSDSSETESEEVKEEKVCPKELLPKNEKPPLQIVKSKCNLNTKRAE